MTFVLRNADGNFLLDYPSADFKFAASPANAKVYYSKSSAGRAAKQYGGLTVAPLPTSFVAVPGELLQPNPSGRATPNE